MAPRRSQGTLVSDFKGDPIKPKVVAQSTTAKRQSIRSIGRRAKDSERDFARWLRDNDGLDPRYKHLTSSTGRIGNITGLRADALSLHYLGENKNELVSSKLLGYWALINEKAREWGKDAVLRLDPSNRGTQYAKLPDMHIITPERHAELLRCERELLAHICK